MTRKSKREVERAVDRLDDGVEGAGGGAPADVTINHVAYDTDGDVVGLAQQLTAGRDDSGEWQCTVEDYDLPNDRVADEGDG